jgi:hypothetical protein
MNTSKKSHGFYWDFEGDIRILYLENLKITVSTRAEGVAVTSIIFTAFWEDGECEPICRCSQNWDPFSEGAYLNRFIQELA